MSKKTIFFSVIAIIMLFFSTNLQVFAQGVSTAPTVKSNEEKIQEYLGDDFKPRTIQDAEDWTERKGGELIGLLQTFAGPFTILVFILGAIFFLIGLLGNSNLSGRGLWAMAISGIVYAGIMYAPDIIASIVEWVRT